MNNELKEEILKFLGKLDAPGIISILEALGIEDDVKFDKQGINIPSSRVDNIERFQKELSVLSKAGRSFPISVVDDRILINTFSEKAGFSNNSSRRHRLFDTKQELLNWGKDEHIKLPTLPANSKVLIVDTDTATGIIAKRIKDTSSSDIYYLASEFGNQSDFTACVKKLGEDHIEQISLQEALAKFPKRYSQAFDVVCVFKCDIAPNQKDDFIRALAQVVKADGVVYITFKQTNQYTLTKNENPHYLTDSFNKYFANVSFAHAKMDNNSPVTMTLSAPKISLDSDFSSTPFNY